MGDTDLANVERALEIEQERPQLLSLNTQTHSRPRLRQGLSALTSRMASLARMPSRCVRVHRPSPEIRLCCTSNEARGSARSQLAELRAPLVDVHRDEHARTPCEPQRARVHEEALGGDSD
jgi:hypothetical protein